jgi:hypothetical protein
LCCRQRLTQNCPATPIRWHLENLQSFEEFSSIEVRMLAGQTPPDFLDFIGKSRAECSKK